MFIVVAGCGMLSGCNACRHVWSHIKSDTVGITRIVTLYNANGGVIKSWEITSTVKDKGGSYRFLTNGKAIYISGTIIMEQK